MFRSPWLVLLVLTSINAANYIDRYVAAAVAPLVSIEFHLTNEQVGTLASAFFLVYTIFAPLFGFLGDRISRRTIIAWAVTLWSLATAAGSVCGSYLHLLWARAAVGVGEAGYGCACPSWIADLFPPEKRGRALSVFYLALPVGTAAGYFLGGYIGKHLGWRAAYTYVGLPGLLLAGLVLLLWEPPRGCNDEPSKCGDPAQAPGAAEYRELVTNREFLTICAGMAAMTFVMGGLAVFAPMFLIKARGMALDEANSRFGMVTALAGFIGTALGGFLGDRVGRGGIRGYLLVSGLGLAAATPVLMVAFQTADLDRLFVLIFFAEILLFLNTGPLNAAMANAVSPRVRTAAYSVNIFVIHLLGDIPSPVAIGMLADRTSLQTAMTATSLVAALAGMILLWGASRARGQTQA